MPARTADRAPRTAGTGRAPRPVRRTCGPARSPAGTTRRRVECAGASGVETPLRRSTAATSASTTRRAMSSCSRNRSPSGDWTVCDVSSVPLGDSTSCTVARSWSPARSSVPMTTRSTSASAASALRSGASPAKRDATALERNDERADPRERRGDRVRKAEGEEVGLRIRPQDAERQHHEPRERVRERRDVGRVDAAHGAQLLRHRLGRRRPIVRALGQRPPDHPIDGGDGRRTGERRRLLVARRVQDLDERAAAERRTSGEHLEQNRARREQIGCGRRRPRPSPARAPCSAACPSATPVRVSPVASPSEPSQLRAARGRNRAA